MRVVKLLLAGIAVAVLLVAAAFYAFPGTLFDLGVSLKRSGAGLERKEVVTEGRRIVYLERGSGAETVVLLHGFGVEKDAWLELATRLPGYRIVIPDLPGFGESDKPVNIKYDIRSQAIRLDRFFDAIGLDRFYIAGSSMGGNIAGIYTVLYQQRVRGLILLDALGVNSPQKSEVALLVEKGDNPLIVSNLDGYRRLMDYIFVKKPFIPSPVEKLLAKKSAQRRELNAKIFVDMIKSPAMLDGHLSSIKVPVLTIWGDRDRILHVSSVQVLERGIKNHTARIVRECGHSPANERPEETAGYIRSFVETSR